MKQKIIDMINRNSCKIDLLSTFSPSEQKIIIQHNDKLIHNIKGLK